MAWKGAKRKKKMKMVMNMEMESSNTQLEDEIRQTNEIVQA
jgi:hypothetical protein